MLKDIDDVYLYTNTHTHTHIHTNLHAQTLRTTIYSFALKTCRAKAKIVKSEIYKMSRKLLLHNVSKQAKHDISQFALKLYSLKNDSFDWP